ncbi:hypothetical protein AVEN_101879-1 [Araneus ventricosus]|uniref:Uncharacterized protein n=1 Tax=Araneus ventricosus TaxID=182803 RepID=A0A4Y2DBT8_ARAVE|nr:hypothetical protein AVEN_101879-1 [Araneus ventricosus]
MDVRQVTDLKVVRRLRLDSKHRPPQENIEAPWWNDAIATPGGDKKNVGGYLKVPHHGELIAFKRQGKCTSNWMSVKESRIDFFLQPRPIHLLQICEESYAANGIYKELLLSLIQEQFIPFTSLTLQTSIMNLADI